MDSLPQPNELIGLFVAVVAALAFVSYLLYAKGMDAGLSRRRVWRTLAAVWLVVLGLLAVLLALRAVIGTPVVEGSTFGGISVAQMTPAKWALLAVAIVVVCAAALWLRQAIAAFDGHKPAHPDRWVWPL